MLGEIPPENSHPEFTYKNLKFTVLESSNKLITKLKLEILPEDSDDEEDSHDKNDKD